jgi:nucleoside-diphosphate-sugar epimerase
MTILEFARHILRMTGASCEIVFESLPEDDPQQRQPDIAKARALLGWEPKVDLEDGLALTVEYFRGVRADAAELPPH